jgi:nickel/cobalt exporter
MNESIHTIYFPAAVLLGALHALEPGHAKALTASYLIGIKGTKRDSVILGLSVALTHSIVVILISAIGLWLGNEAFTGRATQWLETGSGLVAILIGCWMLWRRLFFKKKGAEHHPHHHAPEPICVEGTYLCGTLEIVESPLGERMRFSSTKESSEDELTVAIDRDGRIETLKLTRSPDNRNIFLSSAAPEEPHEFSARIFMGNEANPKESFAFSVTEPEGHPHEEEHAHLDDAAHAAAHAATLPEYAKRGERPSMGQIIAFGAAGGMIPCPASITVMLLALSTGKTGLGVLTVMGFSLGLAVALVGIGVIIVSGLSKLSATGRLSNITRHAPVISAGLVIVSGLFALLFVPNP